MLDKKDARLVARFLSMDESDQKRFIADLSTDTLAYLENLLDKVDKNPFLLKDHI